MLPGLIVPAGLLASGSSAPDALTMLLLHMDGSNGSTTFSDASAGAHTLTAHGSAQISTAQSKFGGASGWFLGAGNYIDTPDSADWAFGSGDFTIDLWFYVSGGAGTYRMMIAQTASDLSTYEFYLGLSSGNKLEAMISDDGTTTYVITGTTSITSTGWHHAAFVRTGNTLKLFVDGTQEGGNLTFSASSYDSANKLTIGRYGEYPDYYWNGYLDEVRVSKGVARWVSNFTPPSAPYV